MIKLQFPSNSNYLYTIHWAVPIISDAPLKTLDKHVNIQLSQSKENPSLAPRR